MIKSKSRVSRKCGNLVINLSLSEYSVQETPDFPDILHLPQNEMGFY